MRRTLLLPTALLVCVFAGRPALAQTTGDIIGIVSDESAAALPGVTVTIRGANIVERSTQTGERGAYRIPALPPGLYEVTYAVAGFATLHRQGIKVSIGTTVEENVTLKLAQHAEEVTVTGGAPVIDTESNQVSTTYDKDWVRNAPIARFTFFDLINAAPGVTQSSNGSVGSTVFGSSTTENAYLVDGTDFTAPYTGQAWPYTNSDAIEEIEVLSLGAPAEYGNIQGAVFNVVTRQGTNAFHGDVNAYLQTQGLTSDNTKNAVLPDGTFADACPTDDVNLTATRCPYHRNEFHDFTALLSGPIVKDKLWFSVGFQYQQDRSSQPGTDPNFPGEQKGQRLDMKVTWQISPTQTLMASYHDDWYRLSGIYNASTALSSVTVEHGHNPAPNLSYTNVLSDKTTLEARVAGFYGFDHGDPLQQGAPRIATRYVNAATGQTTGGIAAWYDGTITKTGLSVKVSHYADRFLGGSHDFKFGIQLAQGGSDYVNGYNDYIYQYAGAYGQLYQYGRTQLPSHLGGQMKTAGVFVDDSYRLGRLTLNLGLRYDWSRAYFPSEPLLDKVGNPTGQSSPAIDNLYTWNVVSPRLGFTYKVNQEGKTVLKGHYGRYYSGIVTSAFERAGPANQPIYTFNGTYDAQGNPVNPVLLVDNLKVDPNMKDPYTDQYIGSLEQQLSQDLGLSLTYTHKHGQDYIGYEDVGGIYSPVTYIDNQGADATGQPIQLNQLQNNVNDRVFNLTNPPQMFTNYNGGAIQISKRMSHNWQGIASVVISKSTGRIGSSTQGPDQQQYSTPSQFNGNYFGTNPNDFVNTSGLLIEDRPVVFKTQFLYQFPKGFLVSVNYTFENGRPWARTLQNSVSSVVNIPFTTILAETLNGSRRLPNQNELAMRIQKDFGISKDVRLVAFLDALNLLNEDAYEALQSRTGTATNFGFPSNYVPPRRFMIGGKLRF
jgi:hypothetical protein